MSKINDMAMTIEELRNAATAINDAANWLAQQFSSDSTQQNRDIVAKQENKTKPALTLEEVRAVLADKSCAGHTAEIRELLKKYGASKLSLVDPKHYEALLREAKLKGNGKSVPALSVLKTPLRDGDLERPDAPAYAGSYFVNANATSAPGIVDADCNPILTLSEVYSGVYVRASISFYAFNSSGNKGIACGLNNLQKIRDAEPLGGKASAESDFATDDDDDFLDEWR